MSDETQVSAVECALLVEDAVARLRHDVFNCLAAVRNASFYIQRRLNGSELWQNDPRIERFFQLIAEQLDAAVARIGLDPKADLPHQRRLRQLDGAECVRAALAALAPELRERVELRLTPGRARADAAELTVALQLCIEQLSDAPSIELTAGPDGENYDVQLTANATAASVPEAQPEVPQRALAVARRVAVASGGRFKSEMVEGRRRIVFSVPSGAEVPEVNSVLIVDDEVAGRATLAALLELEGYTVRECGSLRDASSLLEKGEEFQAVIVDRRLPDGRGDTLAPKIQQLLPAAKIVLITGEAVDRAPPGFDAAHQKGMDPSTLTELVGKLLHGDGEGASAA